MLPDAFIICFWTATDAVLFSIEVQQVTAAVRAAFCSRLPLLNQCWPCSAGTA
jgi:hypothetical protein